jgi:hypothetical protein
MKVLAHSPSLWFLFAEDDRLFLDVNCSHGPVSYDVLVQLNGAEAAQYSARGRDYLDTLAEAINFSGPGVRGSDSVYQSRNVSSAYREQVARAIESWKR